MSDRDPSIPFESKRTINCVSFTRDDNSLPAILRDAANWLDANGYGPDQYAISLYGAHLTHDDEWGAYTLTLEINAKP